MADLNLEQLKAGMITGFKSVALQAWPTVKDFATFELKLLAQSLIEIQSLAVSGRISKAEARSLIRQHKNATIAVISGIEGMTLLTAEQAVNAAIRAIKQALNTAAGFAIV